MNNKGSSGGQFFQTLILALGLAYLIQVFWVGRNQPQPTPPRTAPTLQKAFAGIDPAQGKTLDENAARKEVDRLEKDISKNPTDALAQWSRLRTGLIQQYILNNLKSEVRPSGFANLGPKVTVFPIYQDIVHNAANDPIEAQAIYQSGDLLWRRARADKKEPFDGATQLESLVHKGRGSSVFKDQKIFVPVESDPDKIPLSGIPQGGFKEVTIHDLHGTLQNPIPNGIIDRVNQYRAETSIFYKVFDTAVQALGNNPNYSYGIAILLFAIATRFAMQPIYKRQYDSMKGMALIAPEMKKVQEKYKGKSDQESQMAQMKEIRELQRKHGVNPLMGCGLAMLQMPIFFFVVYPLIQHYEPKMELASATFLWIQSLSRADYLLLVLYGISMFFSFRLSATPPTDEMQRQQQMIMSFMFPVIFPLFLISYPSGFTLYWMTYNAVSTYFQWKMIKAADPSKTLVKSLVGDGLKFSAPATESAIPARPGKTESAEAGLNGTVSPAKASQNGTPKKAAAEGSVLKPAKKKK